MIDFLILKSHTHAIALWSLLDSEGYVRHRQHLEALSILVSQEARHAPR